jgi:integrase
MFLPIILFKVDLLNFSNYCNIMQTPPKKLLDQVRDIIRLKHYSYRTEETYVQWIVRYILFHNKPHPKDMGVHRLMLQLLYGSGLRLRECMELRIKDIDFAQSQMVIRCGKGGKDSSSCMLFHPVVN